MIDELTVLRLVAMKGRVTPDAIGTSLSADAADVGGQLDEYVTRELLKSTPVGFRITPAGRARCTELVAAERRTVDVAAVEQIYATFTERNLELKEVITGWQTRGSDELNDHTDATYDDAVLDRLQALHQQVLPLLDQIADVAPRLGHYRTRLAKAADLVASGERGFVSKPIVDSYHTVWFELHEDLIGLAGVTREEEADEGRGA